MNIFVRTYDGNCKTDTWVCPGFIRGLEFIEQGMLMTPLSSAPTGPSPHWRTSIGLKQRTEDGDKTLKRWDLANGHI